MALCWVHDDWTSKYSFRYQSHSNQTKLLFRILSLLRTTVKVFVFVECKIIIENRVGESNHTKTSKLSPTRTAINGLAGIPFESASPSASAILIDISLVRNLHRNEAYEVWRVMTSDTSSMNRRMAQTYVIVFIFTVPCRLMDFYTADASCPFSCFVSAVTSRPFPNGNSTRLTHIYWIQFFRHFQSSWIDSNVLSLMTFAACKRHLIRHLCIPVCEWICEQETTSNWESILWIFRRTSRNHRCY